MRRLLKAALSRLSPARRATAYRRLRRWRRPAILGTLRRTRPLSERWGSDRGTPVDRYYIEHFLAAHREDIHGRVLEVKDRAYTDRFGTGVTASDVLDVDPANEQATIVGDLAVGGSIEAGSLDCFILTQTLQYVQQLAPAITNAQNALRPGGVLLATLPAITRSSGGDDELPDYWRFTADGCRVLFEEAFGPDAVDVTQYGNVLSAIAFLTGMAQEELRPRELRASDPRFPVIVAVRAVRR
jgi:SAM-dependent methyltransferase